MSEPSANGTLPRAIGVSYINQRTGFVSQAGARNEVIVSMGAFHSPQLLMVSVSPNIIPDILGQRS
jgi:choline dehydrogenase-like flavoprotein